MCHNAHQNAHGKLLRTPLKSLCEWFWSIKQLTSPFYTLSGILGFTWCHHTSHHFLAELFPFWQVNQSTILPPKHTHVQVHESQIILPFSHYSSDFEEATSLMLHLPHTLVKFGLVYHALFCLCIHGKHVLYSSHQAFYPLAHLYLTSSVLLFRWQIGHSEMSWKYLRRKVISTSRCCEAM